MSKQCKGCARPDRPNLGPCCACGKEGPDVRNIIHLPNPGPTPGRGWGCYVCNLPPNGAVAVICDDCQKAGRNLMFICTGYPATDGRTPLDQLSNKDFAHDMEKHSRPDTYERN